MFRIPVANRGCMCVCLLTNSKMCVRCHFCSLIVLIFVAAAAAAVATAIADAAAAPVVHDTRGVHIIHTHTHTDNQTHQIFT